MRSNWFLSKYEDFYKRKGYIPRKFAPYNAAEVKDVCISITCNGGACPTSTGAVLILCQAKRKK